jgi:pimeloyl-ACP methyl ester carboxylesterase
MINIFSTPESSIVVIAALCIAAFVVKKICKFSLAVALAGVAAPVILPLKELPFLRQFDGLHQAYLVGGSWGVLIAAGLGWSLIRPFVSAAVASLGLLKLCYLALLGASLLVSGLLVVDPQLLEKTIPGWKGPLGMLLLAASCVGVSKSLLGMFKSTTLVAVWGGVALILASSIFLDKLPHHITKGDLHKLQGVVSVQAMERIFDRFRGAAGGDSGMLRRFRVKSAPEPMVVEPSEPRASVDA